MSTGMGIGGVLGGVVGFLIGGPVGAAIGFGIGMGIGGMIDPLTPDMPAPGQPDVADLSINQAKEGAVIIDALGTTKIGAANYLWYGKERVEEVVEEVETGGKGGGGTEEVVTGHQYFLSWALGICKGPIDALYGVFANDKLVWSGNLLKPESGGEETIILDEVTLDLRAHRTVFDPGTIIGMGSADFYFGTADQVANASMSAELGAKLNPPYRKNCYSYFDDCFIGGCNRCPTMHFIFRKTPAYAFNSHNIINTYEYNPAHAFWYIFTEMVRLPDSFLHANSFSDVADTLYNEGRGISIQFDKQIPAETYLEAIVFHISGIVRYGNDSKFHLKLKRDDVAVGDLPTVSKDDMLDDLQIDRKSWLDTLNELKVQYVKRTGSVTTGGADWIYKAPGNDQSKNVNSMVVLDNEIYGLNSGYGYLFKWNGVDTWDYLGNPGGYNYVDMVVLNDEIYTAETDKLWKWTGSAWLKVSHTTYVTRSPYCIMAYGPTILLTNNFGQLWIWDGGNNWTQKGSGQGYCYAMCEYLGKVYLGKSSGDLYQWDTVATITKVASYLSVRTISQLFVWNAQLYGWSTGHLWRWNDLNAWVMVDDTLPSVVCRNCLQYESNLYTGSGSRLMMWNTDTDSWDEKVAYNHPFSDGVDELVTMTWDELSRIFCVTHATAQPLYMWDYALGTSIDYEEAAIKVPDVANQKLVGKINHKTIKMGMFNDPVNVAWIADRILKREAWPLAQIGFPANRNVFRWDPGDLFLLNYTPYSISGMVCRVANISEGDAESEEITVSAEEDIEYLSSAMDFTAVEGDPDVRDTSVTALTAVDVVEAPYVLAGAALKVMAITGKEKGTELGYLIYMSDDGATYTKIAGASAYTPYGTLDADYGTDTYGIDDETGFNITFSAKSNVASIETISRKKLFEGTHLALLGSEIISFQTITPVSGTTYKLENIFRGRLDTEKTGHSAGEDFWILDSSLFGLVESPDLLPGQTRYFKLVPYNSASFGELSDASAVTLAITGRALIPYKPINLQADGQGIRPVYTGGDDIVLTWRARIRGADWADFENTAPATIEGYFKMEVYVSAALVRTTEGISDVTWTYTNAMNVSDNGAAADSIEFRISNYSDESGRRYTSDYDSLTVNKG